MKWDSKEKKKSWNKLIKLFAETNDTKQMEQLFELFLTLSEKEAINDRFRIVRSLLTADLPQREIAELLGVSIGKITSGSNELKRHTALFKESLSEKIK